MRQHLFYKLDYGFKWNTQGSMYKDQGKSGLCLYFIWKGADSQIKPALILEEKKKKDGRVNSQQHMAGQNP